MIFKEIILTVVLIFALNNVFNRAESNRDKAIILSLSWPFMVFLIGDRNIMQNIFILPLLLSGFFGGPLFLVLNLLFFNILSTVVYGLDILYIIFSISTALFSGILFLRNTKIRKIILWTFIFQFILSLLMFSLPSGSLENSIKDLWVILLLIYFSKDYLKLSIEKTIEGLNNKFYFGVIGDLIYKLNSVKGESTTIKGVLNDLGGYIKLIGFENNITTVEDEIKRVEAYLNVTRNILKDIRIRTDISEDIKDYIIPATLIERLVNFSVIKSIDGETSKGTIYIKAIGKDESLDLFFEDTGYGINRDEFFKSSGIVRIIEISMDEYRKYFSDIKFDVKQEEVDGIKASIKIRY